MMGVEDTALHSAWVPICAASHHLRAALPLIMSARARARAEVGSTSAALRPEEVICVAIHV